MSNTEIEVQSILLAHHGSGRLPGVLAPLRRRGFQVQVTRNLVDTRDRVRAARPGIVLLRPSAEPVLPQELAPILDQMEREQQFLLHTRALPDLEALGKLRTRVDDLCVGSSPREMVARILLARERLARALEMRRKLALAEERSHTDYKTGLLNDRSIQEKLREECQRADRYLSVLSVIMMDLDGFKELNDREGHPFADFVLQVFAQELKSLIRRTDKAGRFGGDEFLLILPHTGLDEAAAIAERIRRHFEHYLFARNEQRARVTVSQGINTYTGGERTGRTGGSPAEAWTAFLKGADDAVLEAKRRGRNRVCLYPLLRRGNGDE